MFAPCSFLYVLCEPLVPNLCVATQIISSTPQNVYRTPHVCRIFPHSPIDRTQPINISHRQDRGYEPQMDGVHTLSNIPRRSCHKRPLVSIFPSSFFFFSRWNFSSNPVTTFLLRETLFPHPHKTFFYLTLVTPHDDKTYYCHTTLDDTDEIPPTETDSRTRTFFQLSSFPLPLF